MKMYKLALVALACTWSAGALAQWQWLDKDGRKVFSDRAPPVDIPQKSILKQPGVPLPVLASEPAQASAAPAIAVPAPPLPQLSGKDKALEAKKAAAEAAEAAQKKAEEAKVAAARADNCSRAQRAQTTLESGKPLRQTNAQGELVFLDEAARATELRHLQGIIASDCKK